MWLDDGTDFFYTISLRLAVLEMRMSKIETVFIK